MQDFDEQEDNQHDNDVLSSLHEIIYHNEEFVCLHMNCLGKGAIDLADLELCIRQVFKEAGSFSDIVEICTAIISNLPTEVIEANVNDVRVLIKKLCSASEFV
jgi:hypothetical protein